ncbi:TonB-dependent receptor [Rhodobacteraceae bacterium F11138]|nr:TonB-dependent receptor [Rhodobacteraceae bacterium F11138]
MWKTTTGCLLVSTAVLSALPAYAQDQGGLQLDPINVEREDDETGQLTIDSDAIQATDPANLGEVFDGQTVVNSGGALPVAQKTFVHGIEESQLNVTIDGARQNKGSFHHAGNVLFDPSLLKAVTVTPGVATADIGPQALGGAIQYETMDARDLLQDGQTIGGRFRLNYSSNGNTFYGSTTVFGQSEGFEYLLNYSGARGDDYKDGDGNTVAGSSANSDSYLAKFAYTSDAGKRIEFSADYTEDDALRQSRPNFGGLVGRPPVLGQVRSSRTGYRLAYSDESLDGWLAPEIVLAYGEQKYENEQRSGTTTTINGKIQNQFLIGGGTVTAGLDFFDDEATGGDFGAQATEKSRNVGLYAQARQNVTDRLSVSYGGRYDYQWFTGQDGSKFSSGGLSGNASLDYAIDANWTLSAGLSSVWGGYALGEAAVIDAFGSYWTYEGMEPSRSNSARAGFSYADGRWDGGASLFYTEIKGAQYVNIPTRGASVDIETQGIDATIGYTYGQGSVRLNYTYADVTQDGSTPSTTNDYFGIPTGHLFGLQAIHHLNDEWHIGGTASIALENDKTQGVIGGRGMAMYALPAYEVVDIYAVYQPRNIPGLTIRAEVNNLFNETYMNRSSNGGGQNDLIVPLYEPGRAIVLSASLTF